MIDLAQRMGRSANSVAMKLSNYASLDPEVLVLGKKGLSGATRQDRLLWQRFIAEPQRVARECEEACLSLGLEVGAEPTPEYTGHDTLAVQKRRIGQSLFRKAVMIRYDARCVITGLRHEDLLIASHIVPWQARPESRLDPANGLCLNALHDRAFDAGLLAVNDHGRICVSPELLTADGSGILKGQLQALDGTLLILAIDAFPNRDYLAWHFRECFRH